MQTDTDNNDKASAASDSGRLAEAFLKAGIVPPLPDWLDSEPEQPAPPFDPFMLEPFETAPLDETLRIDEIAESLKSIEAMSEESARIASASDKRSRRSFAVGVATLLAALAALAVALFGSPFTT